jgi:hypothetical protein
MERMMEKLDAIEASLGRCSLIRVPITFVAISRNGPPFSWLGFKSHKSMVAGPPLSHSNITDLGAVPIAADAAAKAGIQLLVTSPEKLTAIVCKVLRRESLIRIVDCVLSDQ